MSFFMSRYFTAVSGLFWGIFQGGMLKSFFRQGLGSLRSQYFSIQLTNSYSNCM